MMLYVSICILTGAVVSPILLLYFLVVSVYLYCYSLCYVIMQLVAFQYPPGVNKIIIYL